MANADLYQFLAKPAVNASAFIAMSGAKPSVDSTVHTDICGPLPVLSLTGCRYFVIFIDDYSRFMFTYPMKNRSQPYECYDDFRKKALNIFRHHTGVLEWPPCAIEEHDIQVNQADNTKEYEKLGREIFRKYGTHAQFTNAYTPQQNGVAERRMRTIMERLWYNRIPSMQYMKVFGCSAYVHITKQYRDKLDARARLCMYLGVPDHKKGYRLMDLNSHAIVYSRDVIFKEEEYPSLANLTKTPEQPVIESDQHVHTESIEPVPATASPAGKRRLPPPREALNRTQIHYSFRTEASSETPSRPTPIRPRVTTDDTEVTLNYEEDLQEQEQRRKPLYTLLAIRGILVPHGQPNLGSGAPSERKEDSNLPMGFVVKYTGTGEIDRFKARLAIKGFLQEHGIDYNEIFSPVIRMGVLRLLLTIAALLDLEAHQMDVKTAFLNGLLEEEIYMAQPEGFKVPGKEHLACKLLKSLYGLKQAPRVCDYIPYPIATPAERNVKLSVSGQPSSESEKDAMKDIPYREAVGSIMYLMVGTRPDMAFYMREVSQFLANPGMEHWKAVVRGLK
ncbi:unnamed protein product [Phytophthora fragariaefolia]|uniref:Unnamed protein product n=1 Tax=Phytophthora fragariaefolia TaxID=1490495 RepID=A0A9W6XXL5_9STRA|nr:unnamed protein product [Phytophthora fragariaefolia]